MKQVRNDLRDRNPVVFLLWSYCFTIKGIVKAYRNARKAQS